MKYTQIRTDLWYSFDIMRDTFKRFRSGLSMLAAAIFFSSGISVRAELIPNSFDETSRSHDLRRNVPVAINVYAKNGTVPQVVHEEGVLNGVAYDVLRVDPSEDTFIQVDYSPSAQLLYSLYDYDLVSQGYTRIGGINASFFTGTFTKRKALRLLDEGFVHMIGSDCHNITTRPPVIAQAYDFIHKKFGGDFIIQMQEYGESLLV
jgi:hypothetical protein